MKVLCVKIVNPVTGEEEADSPWIRIGEEYTVLEIYASDRTKTSFRISSKQDDTPVLFDAQMFATVDGRIPPNWTVRVEEGGSVAVAPAAWLEDGFWERYFDSDKEAVAVYEAEKALIVASATDAAPEPGTP